MAFAQFYTETTYLTNYGASSTGGALSRTLVLSLGIVAASAMALAVVVSAISSDRLGRRGMIMVACASAAVCVAAAVPATRHPLPVAFAIALIVTLGLQGLGYGPAGAFLPETFPTRYRYTGAGVSSNLVGILGGAMPPLVAAPLAATFGSSAVGLLLCALSPLSLLCTRALVETKDRDLRQTPPVAPTRR